MQTHERNRNGTPGHNNPSKSKMEGEGKIFPILLAPSSVVADIEIAQATKMRPIVDVAKDLGLSRDDLILKSDVVAKVKLAAVDRVRKGRQGKFVLVTGTTPTRYGEGKTLTTVGLGQALNRLGTKGIVAVREPSLGPVFGTKGGATGGGRAQVLPMEEINLHFTGDIHAVGAANNLIAAILDAHIFHGNEIDIDPTRVLFPRCLDMNDRQLRNIGTGLGGPKPGVPREDGFIITAASEVMAILCLAEGIPDLKARLERIVVAFDRKQRPVGAGDLYVHGAAAILLKDALMPNLVQTLEGTPALAHGGPFANIAHGPNSVRAAPHTFHEDGGAGGEELARLVVDATKASTRAVRFVYQDADAFEEKVAKVATSVYGAAGVKYDAAALEDLERLRAAGLDGLPVCIAKTQLSFSDDERTLGAPTGWTLQGRGIRPSAGAGFLVVLAGDIMRMPGLGEEPAALSMDIDDAGRIKGLF